MQDVASLTSEQYELANRPLAALDIAAFCCAKKYVNERDFRDLCAPALVLPFKRSATPFLVHRDAPRPRPVWPYCRRPIQRAEEHLRARE